MGREEATFKGRTAGRARHAAGRRLPRERETERERGTEKGRRKKIKGGRGAHRGVGQRDRLVLGLELEDGDERAEGLLPENPHVGRRAGDECRREKVPPRQLGGQILRAAAADDHGAALGARVRHVALHL